MLAISHTLDGIYCIEWSSTENGPKVVNHSYIKNHSNIDSHNLLSEIVSIFKPKLKEETNSMSISLNINDVIISQVSFDKSLDKEFFIDWYEKKYLNKKIIDKYFIYYIELLNQNRYITFSIKKTLKENLIKSAKDLGYNLLNLSVDIFSVYTGIKNFYNLEKDGDYLIWKIEKSNYHYLLWCNGQGVKAFVKFKKNPKVIKLIKKIGDSKFIEKINLFLKSFFVNKKKKHKF